VIALDLGRKPGVLHRLFCRQRENSWRALRCLLGSLLWRIGLCPDDLWKGQRPGVRRSICTWDEKSSETAWAEKVSWLEGLR